MKIHSGVIIQRIQQEMVEVGQGGSVEVEQPVWDALSPSQQAILWSYAQRLKITLSTYPRENY